MILSRVVFARRAVLPKRHVRGFTLIELLVAILILSLFMTVALGAVRIADRSVKAGQVASDQAEKMRATADFLRRRVGQMVQSTWFEGDERRLAFAGTSTEVVFIGLAPQNSSGAGYLVYQLTLRPDGASTKLDLSFAPFDPGSGHPFDHAAATQLTIATGFEDARIEYFGNETVDEQPSWRTHWRSDADFFPQALKFRLGMSQERAGWPELIIPVRSAGHYE